METFLAQLIIGVSIGCTYALLATGFNILWLVGGIFQFSYPHMVVLSMYVSWLVWDNTGGNVPLAIVAALLSGILFSLATEPIFRPMTKRGAVLSSFIISLGISIILLDFMNRQIRGGAVLGFPTEMIGRKTVIEYGRASVSIGQVVMIIGTIIIVMALFYLLYKTKLGRSFRAVAQDLPTARIIGIPILKTSIYGYVIAGVLGGVSALFLIMSIGAASGRLSSILAVKVFAVALFAGLGNLKGGLICGVILGVVESIAIQYLPGDWANAIAFSMILGVVIWKPGGLFGAKK